MSIINPPICLTPLKFDFIHACIISIADSFSHKKNDTMMSHNDEDTDCTLILLLLFLFLGGGRAFFSPFNSGITLLLDPGNTNLELNIRSLAWLLQMIKFISHSNK